MQTAEKDKFNYIYTNIKAQTKLRHKHMQMSINYSGYLISQYSLVRGNGVNQNTEYISKVKNIIIAKRFVCFFPLVQ